MRIKRLLLVSLLCSAACKPPTPAEQMDSILSWIGTAGMAGQAWLRHTTPDKYTRETLELAERTVGQISRELLRSEPHGSDMSRISSVLASTRGHISRMADLVAAKDAPTFARELTELGADQKEVKQLADSIGSKQ